MGCSALVLYWSGTGNTRSVAEAIHATLESHGIEARLAKITEDLEIDAFAPNLVFLGAPVYGNLGPRPVMRFLERLRDGSPVLAAAPEQPGHYAVVFCTYGGGHTGVDEAVPFLKYMGQVFAHHGVRVVEEWPVAGEFKGVKDPHYNASGRLGSVVGRPDQRDLDEVSGRVAGLLRRLQHLLGIESLL